MCLLVCLLFSVSLLRFNILFECVCVRARRTEAMLQTNGFAWNAYNWNSFTIHIRFVYMKSVRTISISIRIEVLASAGCCLHHCGKHVTHSMCVEWIKFIPFHFERIYQNVEKWKCCCFTVQPISIFSLWNFHFFMFYLMFLRVFSLSLFLDCIKWSFYPMIINHLYQI